MVSIAKNHALLVVGGFLAGTFGIKALTSKPAKKLYVNAVAQGLKAKAGAEEILEEGKAQFDDILAEAEFLNDSKKPDQQDVVAAASNT